MGIQGLGGFLKAILLISLIAGGLMVHAFNQIGTINQQRADIEELRQQVDLLTGQNDQYRARIDALLRENQQQQAALAEKDQLNQYLQESLRKTQAELQQLQAENTALRNSPRTKSIPVTGLAAYNVPDTKPNSAPVRTTETGKIHLPLLEDEVQMVLVGSIVVLLLNLLAHALYWRKQRQQTQTIRVTKAEREAIIRWRRLNHR